MFNFAAKIRNFYQIKYESLAGVWFRNDGYLFRHVKLITYNPPLSFWPTGRISTSTKRFFNGVYPERSRMGSEWQRRSKPLHVIYFLCLRIPLDIQVGEKSRPRRLFRKEAVVTNPTHPVAGEAQALIYETLALRPGADSNKIERAKEFWDNV